MRVRQCSFDRATEPKTANATHTGHWSNRIVASVVPASEPRRVIDELSEIRMVDVVLPTRSGIELRRRCITEPTDHQAVLLQRLGLYLPSHLPLTERKMKGL